MERHIVLVNPQIHWNTGAVGRTCLGTNSRLHLIEPLGFSLDSRYVRRAGLDYWDKVSLQVWPDWETFATQMQPHTSELYLFSRFAVNTHWRATWPERCFLVFGSETRGLPDNLKQTYADQMLRIPTNQEIRSLNLATSVGIALFESLRENPGS